MEWQDVSKELAKKFNPHPGFWRPDHYCGGFTGRQHSGRIPDIDLCCRNRSDGHLCRHNIVPITGREKMGAEPGSTPVNEPELKPEPAPIPQSELEPATPVTPIDALQARRKIPAGSRG